ncbi:MAG: hypothetical protein AAGK32_21105, partial [Actinomycetota bacterium]
MRRPGAPPPPRPEPLAVLAASPTVVIRLARQGGRLVVEKVPADRAGRRVHRRLARQARVAAALGVEGVLEPNAEPARTGWRTWPWMAGGDLAGRVRRHGALPGDWADEVAETVDDTVRSLHRSGGVHGAITPEHVLLDADGRPVLTGLDPSARADHRTRRADLDGVDSVRAWARHGEEPARPASTSDAAPRGPGPRSARRWIPVGAGVAVAALGALGALVRTGTDDRCPSERGPLAADVDGDGCEDALEWSTRTGRLSADTGHGRRVWILGRPGDRL